MYQHKNHHILPLSRRTFIKGLLGLAITLSEISCGSPSSSPPSAPTKPVVRPIPTPTNSVVSPTVSPSIESTLYTYKGHSRGVLALAWSPNGTHIASGSED